MQVDIIFTPETLEVKNYTKTVFGLCYVTGTSNVLEIKE